MTSTKEVVFAALSVWLEQAQDLVEGFGIAQERTLNFGADPGIYYLFL